jgi:hypothetical protein
MMVFGMIHLRLEILTKDSIPQGLASLCTHVARRTANVILMVNASEGLTTSTMTTPLSL